LIFKLFEKAHNAAKLLRVKMHARVLR